MFLDGVAAAMPGFAWAAPALLGSGHRSNMPPCPPRWRPLSRRWRGLACERATVERLDSIGNSCIFSLILPMPTCFTQEKQVRAHCDPEVFAIPYATLEMIRARGTLYCKRNHQGTCAKTEQNSVHCLKLEIKYH